MEISSMIRVNMTLSLFSANIDTKIIIFYGHGLKCCLYSFIVSQIHGSKVMSLYF